MPRRSAVLPPALKLMLCLPLPPAMLATTFMDFDSTSGYTCTLLIWHFGLAAKAMRPTMPFQLPCVWSVTLWESCPTHTFSMLL